MVPIPRSASTPFVGPFASRPSPFPLGRPGNSVVLSEELGHADPRRSLSLVFAAIERSPFVILDDKLPASSGGPVWESSDIVGRGVQSSKQQALAGASRRLPLYK
jgi:hypothetical protein